MDKITRIRQEIERLKKRAEHFEEISLTGGEKAYWSGESGALELLTLFLDSLQQEQPEGFAVNQLLEILSDRVKLFKGWSSETVSPIRIDECEQIIDIIKQLIPAQNKDWEEKRKQECGCRRLSANGDYQCERYKGNFGPCDGRCSWIVDYPKLKELKEMKQPEMDLEKGLADYCRRYYNYDYPKQAEEGTGSPTMPHIIEAAKYFYELGQKDAANKYDEIEYNRQRAEEEMLGQTLDEAAEKYVREGHLLPEEFLVMPVFKAGAKWQEEKNQEIIKLAEDHAFLAGADWQKEQMMKEAVEANVIATKCGDKYQQLLIADWNSFSNLLNDDKVRVVVLKKEEDE